jgi:hypothetical protein
LIIGLAMGMPGAVALAQTPSPDPSPAQLPQPDPAPASRRVKPPTAVRSSPVITTEARSRAAGRAPRPAATTQRERRAAQDRRTAPARRTQHARRAEQTRQTRRDASGALTIAGRAISPLSAVHVSAASDSGRRAMQVIAGAALLAVAAAGAVTLSRATRSAAA